MVAKAEVVDVLLPKMVAVLVSTKPSGSPPGVLNTTDTEPPLNGGISPRLHCTLPPTVVPPLEAEARFQPGGMTILNLHRACHAIARIEVFDQVAGLLARFHAV